MCSEWFMNSWPRKVKQKKVASRQGRCWNSGRFGLSLLEHTIDKGGKWCVLEDNDSVSFQRQMKSKTYRWKFRAVGFRWGLKWSLQGWDFDGSGVFNRLWFGLQLTFHLLHGWWKCISPAHSIFLLMEEVSLIVLSATDYEDEGLM